MKTATLKELADLVGGTVSGDEQLTITALSSLDLAGAGELSFINSLKLATRLAETKASACIVPEQLDKAPLPVIRAANPDLAAALIHNYLLASEFVPTGIHASAVVGDDVQLGEQVSIGALVSIGDRVKIGERVTLHPGVVVGDDVTIGDDTILHANVVVAYGCIIGAKVILHHGAVIGSDGFGFATDLQTGRHVTKPQVGTVRIDDNVQVGANTCIDRAAFGVTRVKEGARIDNLVMVGHNCVIGENSILVGQVGIAGSTTLGRNVVLGARAGLSGHLTLGDGVMVAAMSGVHNNQPRGAVIGGIPAIEVKKWGRVTAAHNRLPDMVKEVRNLRRELEQLKEMIADKVKTENDNECD